MANIRPISELLAKKAKEELNEDPARIQEDINVLKTWLTKQPHLRARTDDQFLVTFLRGTKFSLERAKEKIDMFYTIRTLLVEVMTDRNPYDCKILEMIRMGVVLPLPLTEKPDSPRITLIRPGVYDATKYTINDVIKVGIMLIDILILEDDNIAIAGPAGILDLSNVTLQHFLQLSPSFIKKMTISGQEASPFRHKGVNFIHTPTGFETIFNIFKSFLSVKNQQKLYVHGDNMESLYQQIPKHILPTEYGGNAGPIQNIIDEWEKKILSYKTYFEEEKKFGVDEKNRIYGTSKSAVSLFGINGSFRKLEVD